MGLLRLLLALSVVIHHTYPLWGYNLIFGDIPVRTFFIISGFYMALILSERYPAGNYRLFITNRFLRIYPLYWIVLIATLIFLFFFTHFSVYTIQKAISDFTLLLRTDYFIFDPTRTTPLVVGQAWTLVIELLFYLLAPFLMRRSWVLLMFLAASSVVIRYFVYHFEVVHGFQPKDTFFPSDLIFFILGIFSYKMYRILRKRVTSHKFLWIGFFTLLTFTLFYQYLPDYTVRYISFKEIFYYSTVTILLPYIFLLSQKNRFDRFIGELSYPVYIWHACISLVISRVIDIQQDVIYTILVIVLTLLISLFSAHYIIFPLDRYREKRLLFSNNP